MVQVVGLKKLQNKLRKMRFIEGSDTSIITGYTANYALMQHENLELRHKKGRQAKFLEQPAREMSTELLKIVETTMKAGGTMTQGLKLAGLALQRASMKLVPIDTGNLRGSAFTKVEK